MVLGLLCCCCLVWGCSEWNVLLFVVLFCVLCECCWWCWLGWCDGCLLVFCWFCGYWLVIGLGVLVYCCWRFVWYVWIVFGRLVWWGGFFLKVFRLWNYCRLVLVWYFMIILWLGSWMCWLCLLCLVGVRFCVCGGWDVWMWW